MCLVGLDVTSDVTEQEDDQKETIEGHEGSKQPSIKHFFMKTVKDAVKGQSSLPDTRKADHREETMSLPDQICKAEALWVLKTAKDDFISCFRWFSTVAAKNVS